MTIWEAIVELVSERGPEKTICPSEAARLLWPEEWRNQMEDVRQVARQLAREGLIEISRKGERLDPDRPFGGPIRLRLTASELP